MKRIVSVLAIAAAAAFAQPAAAAGSVQANVTVTATISNNCTVAAGSVDFGAYDPLVTNATVALDKSGTIAVSCTAGTVGSIELADGSNFSAPNRQMSGAGLLKYELYKDAGRLQRWGTVAATQEQALPGFVTTSTQTVTIYGRVFAGQTSAPVGAYSDTVVATVNF